MKNPPATGDAGYLGAGKRDELKDKNIEWEITVRLSKRKTMNDIELALEKTKASIRSKVEHRFRIIKRQFGYDKVCLDFATWLNPGKRGPTLGKNPF